jgi:hypothetical protein
MPRAPQSQGKHDRKVASEARNYYNKGYDVWSDIADWPKPQTIGGYRPDVIAYSNGHTTVVEVETVDSVNSSRDLAQQRAFKSWAARKSTRHFKRIVT